MTESLRGGSYNSNVRDTNTWLQVALSPRTADYPDGDGPSAGKRHKLCRQHALTGQGFTDPKGVFGTNSITGDLNNDWVDNGTNFTLRKGKLRHGGNCRELR
jgi:hypothetical protein